MLYVDRFTREVVKAAFGSQRLVPVTCTKCKVDPVTKVERGYIPLDVRVNDMLAAGRRLVDEKRARFDSLEQNVPVEELRLDPLREPGVDILDVARIAERQVVKIKAEEAARIAAEKEKADALRQAEINAAVEKALQEKALKAGL